jgi:hypothetical protein
VKIHHPKFGDIFDFFRCCCSSPVVEFPERELSHRMVYTLVVHFRVKDQDAIAKVKDKLIEASQVYSRDKETVSWFIMQSVHDEKDFSEFSCPVRGR